MKKVIRLTIYQPSAHYRIPFSFQRRFTYPIPPHSTVKGFLCNIMGIQDDQSQTYKTLFSGLSIGIFGKYQSIVKEYVWFRNLSADSHKKRFQTAKNRTVDGIPQHPGGQMPVAVDVLHEITLILYITHTDTTFQKDILKCFQEPKKFNSILHLGRSEDWLVFEDISEIEPVEKPIRKLPYFSWLPDTGHADETMFPESLKKNYSLFYDSVDGNAFRIPLFYTITENNERIFNEFLRVKLFEGGSFPIKSHFFVDESFDNLPIILTKIRGNHL